MSETGDISDTDTAPGELLANVAGFKAEIMKAKLRYAHGTRPAHSVPTCTHFRIKILHFFQYQGGRDSHARAPR